MPSVHDELLQEFRSYAKNAASAQALMEHIAIHLHEKMTRYNWTGFYLVDPTDSNFLIVGPFAGSFTPNARIPLDKGLCGAAATSGKVVVVQDVSKDPRYLARRHHDGKIRDRCAHLRPQKARCRTRHRIVLRRHLHKTRTRLRRILRRHRGQLHEQVKPADPLIPLSRVGLQIKMRF
jgi:hypothetical protein